ncbi:MAG: SGNH/GDSL hydrolase family protein [Candidatus Limnocylindria bacterium]
MDRWLVRVGRFVGAALGAFAGLVAVQFMRLRRTAFLPGWPGFRVNHLVQPAAGRSTAEPLTLVVLGDSTTAGVGVSRPQDALPFLLARRVADAEARPVRVISYGWAGARASDLPGQQVAHASGVRRRPDETGPVLRDADVVAIVIGSNDATHRTPPGRFRASLRATLEQVREQAPGARIVLGGIPRFRGALRALEPLIFMADQYARLLRPISRGEAARAGAAYGDIHGRVPALIAGRTDVLSSDGFHPSAVLYDAWARVIFEALQEGPASAADVPSAPMEPAGA